MGVVHGVVHGVCPSARIVDLTHAIPAGDVLRAAFVLEAAAPDFALGTIHLAVIDPGVGTDRRALAVAAHGQFFVGPDNGVLEWALADPKAEVHALTEAKYFRSPVSRTFHGRDVFAPVAAHLACGVPIAALGPAVKDPIRLKHPEPYEDHGALYGTVMFVDRFGNAITNLNASVIAAYFPNVAESDLVTEIAGRSVRGLARSYGDAPIGTLVAILGSSGRLELAEVGGHASSRFGVGPRDPVRIRLEIRK